ncbi:hypothetical protein [Aquibacillus albus]|uniref:Uncharacterized protein n=1 Tax=Aquibacillus albus TaxID=1168171 RepID=A0ABS2N3V3_9BACI|nr:hypothetical protein [Aquibacillus albus]MBM7572723.1 hypothetical protein [Aquibacillus albus]
MKVKVLIGQLEKTLSILKQYENWETEDMLDDIYTKVSTDSAKHSNHKDKQLAPESFQESIIAMGDLNKDEIIEFLKKYKKHELIEIGKQLQLKLAKRDKKIVLIESIANHFSFIQLNGMMANRNQQRVEKVTY